jgi:hypothetical protein
MQALLSASMSGRPVRKAEGLLARVSLGGVRLATGAAVACGLLVLTLTVAIAKRAKPCHVVEPDSLAINWTAPCDEGRWLLDPQSGCRMWDWHPSTPRHGPAAVRPDEKKGEASSNGSSTADRSIASRASTAVANAKALAATIGRPGSGSTAPTPTTCPTDGAL